MLRSRCVCGSVAQSRLILDVVCAFCLILLAESGEILLEILSKAVLVFFPEYSVYCSIRYYCRDGYLNKKQKIVSIPRSSLAVYTADVAVEVSQKN